MTDSHINLKDLQSDFQAAYDAVMYGSGLSSNGSAQKNAVAFTKQVKKTLPNDYSKTSMPGEGGYYNRFSGSRFRVEASGNLPSSALESSDGAASSDAAGKFFTASSLKQLLITALDSEEPCLDERFAVSVKPKMVQEADFGSESEIKFVQVRSRAVEEGSHSVNNSHQYSNVQICPIIQSDNLSNEHVLTPPEQVAGNKASRLERQRGRGKDPAYKARAKELQRERMRKLRKDPAYKARAKELQRERMRKLRKDPAYKARERELRRERCKDPVYSVRKNELHRERMRERRKDPVYKARENKLQKERMRERRKDPVYKARENELQKERMRGVAKIPPT